MSTEPVRVERRAGQRFEVNLPVVVSVAGQTMTAFTQDVSARGAFLYTEQELPEGASVELTFTMPSEITLTKSMRVRCLGRVLRRLNGGTGQRDGVAVHLDSYEYLAESESAVAMGRVSAPSTGRQSAGGVPRG
jgi:hypothetical protein